MYILLNNPYNRYFWIKISLTHFSLYQITITFFVTFQLFVYTCIDKYITMNSDNMRKVLIIGNKVIECSYLPCAKCVFYSMPLLAKLRLF